MDKEKRMIGEYEILCSVNVGKRETILASNEKNTDGGKFMCGFLERTDLFDRCTDCMVSDDYMEIVQLFGNRVYMEAEHFQE